MSPSRPLLLAAAPAVFVVLWATGFVGAKFGLPHAEPFTFLVWRFWCVAAIFLAVVLVSRAPWPRSVPQALHNVFVGVLLHGVYLGGVFAAIAQGMPAGLSAIIVGLQPALTALVARVFLNETVSARQWAGIGLGFAGLVFVVGAAGDGLDLAAAGGTGALALCIAALFGITFASLWQKTWCGGEDLRTGALFQYVGGAMAVSAAAFATETGRVDWTGEFVFAFAWLVLVLSVGAVTLLMLMIRHGDISRVASLFYLVPPVTALMTWALFGETLSTSQLLGVFFVAFGVMLVTREKPRKPAVDTP